MHGSDKFGGETAPTHAFGDWQSGDGLADDVGDDFFGGLAFDRLGVAQPFAFVGFQAFQLLECRPTTLRETQRRLAGRTVRRECRLDSRATFFHSFIGLRGLEIVNQHRQTARRGIGFAGGKT